MQVPPKDIICRFIRLDQWNAPESLPRAGAFKARNGVLSVWHCDKVHELGADLSRLCFGSLDGAGQAHHMAHDYVVNAQTVSQGHPLQFAVTVEWRNGAEYVHPEWSLWKPAHAQVETDSENRELRGFPPRYRELMALGCRTAVPPGVFGP